MIKKILDDQKGIALITTLLILITLTSLSVLAIKTINTDIQIAGNMGDMKKAFYCAEAGIRHAVHVLYKICNNGFSDELIGTDGTCNTSDDGILSFGSSINFADGIYEIRLTDNDDGDSNLFNDIDNTIIITSNGKTNGANQVIEIVLTKIPEALDIDGALSIYGLSNPTINIDGDPTISGKNYYTPTTFICSNTGCSTILDANQPGILGLYTEKPTPTLITTGSPNISGDPNAVQYSGGHNINWGKIVKRLIPQANTTYTGLYIAGNIQFGNRTTSEITIVKTQSGSTTNFSGNIDGAGILIIHGGGDIKISGNFHYEGVIIILADNTNSINLDINGTLYIFGSLVLQGANSVNLDMNGCINILYNSQAIINASNLNNILRIISWKNVY